MPNHRRVHATVAVAAVLFFTVVIPLLLMILQPAHSLAIVSCFTITFALYIWFCFGRTLQTYLIPILIVAIFTDAGSAFFKDYFTGKRELLAAGMSLFGLAMSLWGLYKLFTITEDDPAYGKFQAARLFKGDPSLQTTNSTSLLSKKWSDRLADWHVARLSRHARRAYYSPWSSLCRWQLGVNLGMVFRLCFSVIFMIAVMYLASRQSPRIYMLSVFVSIMPITMIAMLHKLRCLSRELMLPVDRKTFVRQMGINAAVIFFLFWAITWILLLTVFSTIFEKHYPSEIIFHLTLISAFCNVLYFGMLVWFTRWASRLWNILVVLVPLYLQMGLMAAATEYDSGSLAPWMTLAAACAAMVGVFIVRDAHRRWLLADIG
jgi:hypothetical protein